MKSGFGAWSLLPHTRLPQTYTMLNLSCRAFTVQFPAQLLLIPPSLAAWACVSVVFSFPPPPSRVEAVLNVVKCVDLFCHALGKWEERRNPQLLTPGLRGKCTFFVKPCNNSPSVSAYTQQMFSWVLKRPLKRRVLHYLKLQLCKMYSSAVPSFARSLVHASSFFPLM